MLSNFSRVDIIIKNSNNTSYFLNILTCTLVYLFFSNLQIIEFLKLYLSLEFGFYALFLKLCAYLCSKKIKKMQLLFKICKKIFIKSKQYKTNIFEILHKIFTFFLMYLRCGMLLRHIEFY